MGRSKDRNHPPRWRRGPERLEGRCGQGIFPSPPPPSPWSSIFVSRGFDCGEDGFKHIGGDIFGTGTRTLPGSVGPLRTPSSCRTEVLLQPRRRGSEKKMSSLNDKRRGSWVVTFTSLLVSVGDPSQFGHSSSPVTKRAVSVVERNGVPGTFSVLESIRTSWRKVIESPSNDTHTRWVGCGWVGGRQGTRLSFSDMFVTNSRT